MIGGLDMQAQAKALAQRPHIVVATPGRLRVSHFKDTRPSIYPPCLLMSCLSMSAPPDCVRVPEGIRVLEGTGPAKDPFGGLPREQLRVSPVHMQSGFVCLEEHRSSAVCLACSCFCMMMNIFASTALILTP